MRLPLLLLLVLVPLLPVPVAAQCAYREPSITVRPLPTPTPQIETQVAMRDIKGLASGQAGLGTHDVSVGLTVSSLGMNSSFEVVSDGRGHNLCAQISRLSLDIGFKDTLIYIASELPPGSCAYETVLEHEFRHVATDQRVLAAYLPQLSILIGNALRQIGPLPTSTPDQAEAALKQMVNEYLSRLAANLASIREREQQDIDTPEEYRRISLSCNGEVQRLANVWN